VGKHWGSIKLGVGQVGIYFTALNLVMISVTLWTTGWIQKNIIPLQFWQFIVILAGVIFGLMLLAWRIDMPSYFAAWNDQFYRHKNPLKDDIKDIIERLKRLEKQAGINCDEDNGKNS